MDVIRRIVLDPGFWDGYLARPWQGEEDDPPTFTCDLPLLTIGHTTLELRVLQNPNLMTLFLRQRGELPPELGYDDDCAQFLPWTLRWDELDLIARLAALDDPGLRHPGPYLALLSRFTPLTTDEEFARARPMLATALAALREGPPVPELRSGPGLDERLAHHLDHWDQRKAYVWQQDHGAWSLNDEALTLRSRGSAFFPFEAWGAFMTDVASSYHGSVAAAWRALPALRGLTADGDLPRAARQLEAVGCVNRTVLRALREPISQAESAWVVELLMGL